VPHLGLPGRERHAALGEIARRRVDRVVSEHVLAAARTDGLRVVAILQPQQGAWQCREALPVHDSGLLLPRPARTWLMTRVLL